MPRVRPADLVTYSAADLSQVPPWERGHGRSAAGQGRISARASSTTLRVFEYGALNTATPSGSPRRGRSGWSRYRRLRLRPGRDGDRAPRRTPGSSSNTQDSHAVEGLDEVSLVQRSPEDSTYSRQSRAGRPRRHRCSPAAELSARSNSSPVPRSAAHAIRAFARRFSCSGSGRAGRRSPRRAARWAFGGSMYAAARLGRPVAQQRRTLADVLGRTSRLRRSRLPITTGTVHVLTPAPYEPIASPGRASSSDAATPRRRSRCAVAGRVLRHRASGSAATRAHHHPAGRSMRCSTNQSRAAPEDTSNPAPV